MAQPRVHLQDLTANLGFAAPRLIEDCGLLDKYEQAMNAAVQAYKILTEFSRPVTAYIVPYGFNRRLAISMNLREAFHFCSLRTSPQTHFSARHVALQVIEKISRLFPNMATYSRSPQTEIWQSVEKEFFVRTK